MTHYLISFPSAAMQVSAEEFPTVVEESHAVIAAAKAAGVYVFGGGLDDSVAPVRVAGDGTLTDGPYPVNAHLDGGFCVVRVDSRAEALEWAARIAASCRCPQEVRAFHFDPES